MENRFPESSPVKVRLLQGAVYVEDARTWSLLLAHQSEIARYFHDLGALLVVDVAEGYAYIEQMDVDDDHGMVRLFRRRQLSFETTMLLVILREELLRFDAKPLAVATIPTVEHEWLIEQMSAFVPERNNRVKRQTAIEQVIRGAVQLGVLREVENPSGAQTYQIMRIVKAKLPEEKLSEVKERLQRAAAIATAPEGKDGTPTAD